MHTHTHRAFFTIQFDFGVLEGKCVRGRARTFFDSYRRKQRTHIHTHPMPAILSNSSSNILVPRFGLLYIYIRLFASLLSEI